MPKQTEQFNTIEFTARMDADGDVYILAGNKFKYIGKIGESDFGSVPDKYYLKIKKWINKPQNN